ncbi:AMP-binding protein [Alcaligenaceae bacterium]|nr:AMP-binding protein [Alcaligenaceae bacterium]
MNGRILASGTELSREQLGARADQLASGFASAGLLEGDIVAVMLRNSMPYLEIIQGVRRLGCYYCPINWHFTAAEVAYLVQDSGAKIFISDSQLYASVAEALPPSLPVLLVDQDEGAHSYTTWRDSQPPYTGPAVAPRGHMAYTSGTTGRPKGVMRHPFPMEELQERQQTADTVINQAYGVAEGSRVLLSAPIYHSAPSLYTQVALRKASLFVVTERFDPRQILGLIQEHKIEAVYMVPIMYTRLLALPEHERLAYDVSSLKFVVSTGSPCPTETKRAMIAWFGPVIYETYASSEAGLVTLINSQEALERPGSVGRPLAEATVRIYDEQGVECKPGTVGRIFVRQPAYADFSYRGNPQARTEIEHEGLIGLGDLGLVDEQGYLYVCDRESDMVISGGVNIYPAEIEQHIFQYPGVADCVVIGVPDAEYGERLLALIQPKADSDIQFNDLKPWLESRMARYKIPRLFELRSSLPRDDSGKVLKRKLRSAYWEGRDTKV